MRPNINAEIAHIAEEYVDGGIEWNMRDVKRLIYAYLQVDHIINNLGDDYSHDCIHDMKDAEHNMEDADMSSATSDEDDATAFAEDDHVTAVADDNATAVAADDTTADAADESRKQIAPLSSPQADGVHQHQGEDSIASINHRMSQRNWPAENAAVHRSGDAQTTETRARPNA